MQKIIWGHSAIANDRPRISGHRITPVIWYIGSVFMILGECYLNIMNATTAWP